MTVFTQQAQDTIIYIPRRSIRDIAEQLKVGDFSLKCEAYKDIKYTSYTMWRGQYMSNNTFIGPIRLLVKLRHPDNSNIDLEAEGEQEEHQVALGRPPRRTYGDAHQVHVMCYGPYHVVIFFLSVLSLNVAI